MYCWWFPSARHSLFQAANNIEEGFARSIEYADLAFTQRLIKGPNDSAV
jgi:hypothetical protein